MLSQAALVLHLASEALGTDSGLSNALRSQLLFDVGSMMLPSFIRFDSTCLAETCMTN